MKTINGITGFIKFVVSGTTSNAINYENAKFDWEVTKIGGNNTGSNKATVADGIEIFTVLADPSNSAAGGSPWNVADNTTTDDRVMPWVTALRFAIDTAGTKGEATPATALSQLTSYLHNGHGMTYDTTNGAPGFGTFHGNQLSQDSFNLTNYINKTGTVVNCYDQAAAVYTLGRLLGIEVNYAYMNKFGYINTVNLVGVGNCNNPFYVGKPSPYNVPVVGSDDTGRTRFGNHAFAMLGDNVYDACALTLGELFSSYLTSAIDTSTPAESAVAGTVTNRVFRTIALALP